MAHVQKPDFVFRRNGRVHLNRWGCQFSPLLAAEVCASAVVMLDTPCSEAVWRVLATHCIRQFPLHFPSCASLCAITFQLDSAVLLIMKPQSLIPRYRTYNSPTCAQNYMQYFSTAGNSSFQEMVNGANKLVLLIVPVRISWYILPYTWNRQFPEGSPKLQGHLYPL